MPRAAKQRAGGHLQSARLRKTQPGTAPSDSAVPAGDVNQATLGSASSQLAVGHVQLEEEARQPAKKKERQALKHETFLQRLEASRSPYSKSHERRLKRKSREQVAGGLGDVTAAISELDAGIPVVIQQSVFENDAGDQAEETPQRPKATSLQIGEGKGAPLTKSQRKKALQAERMRIPLILANPEFSTNPFKTIRTHAQNTLVKHNSAR